MGGMVAVYMLVWSLSNGQYLFEGQAKFPNLEECEKAKAQFGNNKFIKKEFEGYIQCELKREPPREITQKPKKWKHMLSGSDSSTPS